MQLYNGRKVCELQIQKQAYLRHLSRLQQLKDGKSPQQVSRNREQKKIVEAINTVRKMHTFNRQFKLRQMREIQQQSKDIDFNKIKSVVTSDFNRPIPTIAPKHKRNEQPIFDENLKIFKRILNTKPNLSFKTACLTQREKKPKNGLPILCSLDFSKLYQTSRINESQCKILCMKLSRPGKNKYSKVRLEIDTHELFQYLKDVNSMYAMLLYYRDLKVKSVSFILEQMKYMKVILKIPDQDICDQQNKITLRFMKILDLYEKKQVCKARLYCGIQKGAFKKFDIESQTQKQDSLIDQSEQKMQRRTYNLDKTKTKKQGMPCIKMVLQKQLKLGFINGNKTKKEQVQQNNIMIYR